MTVADLIAKLMEMPGDIEITTYIPFSIDADVALDDIYYDGTNARIELSY